MKPELDCCNPTREINAERERVCMLLVNDASKGIDYAATGTVNDAREVLTALKNRRSEERPN